MQIIHHIKELRAALKQAGTKQNPPRVGLVPTMGFLHQGHASLLVTARGECDIVVLSIFVNPLQFGPNEDFARYPRNEEQDLAVAKEAGADIVFLPSVEEMYPRRMKTTVSVAEVTDRLCGASRPGHFDGVATVVTKLFNIIQPDKAYFGLKDAQQVAVIQQMVNDLNIPVEIVPCPIVREKDGLAMSSRNVYLQPEERSQALTLSSALAFAKKMVEEREQGGTLEAETVKSAIRRHISAAPLADIDYVELLAYPSLEPVNHLKDASDIIIALAVKFGRTRLIDNMIIHL